MNYAFWSVYLGIYGGSAPVVTWTDPSNCAITTDVTMTANSLTDDVTLTANSLTDDVGMGCGNQ